jgi:hypothetical protein
MLSSPALNYSYGLNDRLIPGVETVAAEPGNYCSASQNKTLLSQSTIVLSAGKTNMMS